MLENKVNQLEKANKELTRATNQAKNEHDDKIKNLTEAKDEQALRLSQLETLCTSLLNTKKTQ